MWDGSLPVSKTAGALYAGDVQAMADELDVTVLVLRLWRTVIRISLRKWVTTTINVG